MRKRLFYLTMLSTMVVGCSANGQSHFSEPNKEDEVGLIKEDVSIEFLCLTDSKYKVELDRMIDGFKKVEPHVTVNLINPPAAGNYNVLEKIVMSGFFKEDYPDIVQCYPDNVVKYIDRGYALNLDAYLNNADYGLKDEKSDYIDSFLNEGANYSVEGTYSLPFCKSTELMYYNADKLLNLDLSTIDSSINNGKPLDEEYLDDLTWEELFQKLCPAIKTYNENQSEENKIYDDKIDDKGTPGIFTYDSDENFFITLAEQYGYGYTSYDKNLGKGSIDFNNQNMINLIKSFAQAKDNGYLQTKGSYGNYVSDLFIQRKSLFTVSSTAGLSYNYDSNNKMTIGVAKIPHPEGKGYLAINQGPSVCILDHKDDNRSLASFLFWKHITNKENSSSWAINTGYLGIRHSAYSSAEYLAALNPKDINDLYAKAVSDNLKKIAEVSANTFNTAVFKGSSNARTNVGMLMTNCLKSTDLDNEINDLFLEAAQDCESYL